MTTISLLLFIFVYRFVIPADKIQEGNKMIRRFLPIVLVLFLVFLSSIESKSLGRESQPVRHTHGDGPPRRNRQTISNQVSFYQVKPGQFLPSLTWSVFTKLSLVSFYIIFTKSNLVDFYRVSIY